MRKALFLLGLVFYVSAYYRVEYEKGTDNHIHWAPEPFHILHGSSAYESYCISLVYLDQLPLR